MKRAPPPSLAVFEEKVQPLAMMEVVEEGSLGAALTGRADERGNGKGGMRRGERGCEGERRGDEDAS